MTVDLTVACGPYDRTAALADGRVRVPGVDLTWLPLGAEEIFFRMARHAEFSASEMSLSSYTLTLERDRPFVAIPVFPSRTFRHHAVYVHADSDLTHPEQLKGRTVGIPEYQMTAAVWMRGIFAEHYGLPVDSVSYRTGGLLEPGRTEKLAIHVPGVDIRPIAQGQNLSDMLEAGELDALYTARVPRHFADGTRRVRRLWADPAAAEREYFARTGIFPIMHTVVLRRDVYERNRWLARALTDAFQEAKEHADRALGETVALAGMLPWGHLAARSARDVMGEDIWPYGLAPNHACLTAFLRHLHEQGLTGRRLAPEELFAPETHESFVV
ncbi:ABC transporter substrate-binding protein [Streptomyces griseoflavus]|uniref:ABC transporter substrate-binding protein n=1 Tax=Streptomyces griseoflavus TaxID=35619 RepID=UPI0019CA13FD|nr:ABC transporter substrate-binding protein [Streptomyces griseoflavus]GGV13465.1 4,5-dihydroxyphthalate decarboxylase [Streptomyces griseoflavus]